jgi:hypothetical protein
LDDFRPGNFSSRRRQDRHRPCRDSNQSRKKSSAGPPSKIWIGSFSYSYS